MTIACNSFKLELLQGVHVFAAVAGDTFNLALYDPSATLSANTTAYTTSGEVVGAGYSPGGIALGLINPVLTSGAAIVTFNNAIFSAVSISTRYGLIYNASKANRAVAVLDFGQTVVASGSTLEVVMPAATPTNAIIRVN